MYQPFKRNRTDRPQRNKKTGMKDKNIDAQILVLHQAIGEKLLSNPSLVEEVKCRLEIRKEEGLLSYGAYINWFSLLEDINQPERFMSNLLEDSGKMRRLRRTTPLTGILSEEERQNALAKQSCGETSLAVLY